MHFRRKGWEHPFFRHEIARRLREEGGLREFHFFRKNLVPKLTVKTSLWAQRPGLFMRSLQTSVGDALTTKHPPPPRASFSRILRGSRPWAMPQVLSRKLNQRYFRGSLYMETDVEIGSSVAAESVVRGACNRYQQTDYCCVCVFLESFCEKDPSRTNAGQAGSAAALLKW